MIKTYGFNLKDIRKSNAEMSAEVQAILEKKEQDLLESDKKEEKEEKPKRKKFLGII